MKECEKFLKHEDKISRYCSLHCDKGNCITCRIDDTKQVIYKMQNCSGENVDCETCELIARYRKISPMTLSRIAKAR